MCAATGRSRGGAVTPAPLPGFLNSLAGPLDHYGLWAVLLFVLIEDFGIPVPGETILIAASVYAGVGRLNVVLVAVVAFAAAVTGDNIGFAIGHFGGRALALRWGRYVFLTEARLDKAEAFQPARRLDHHGRAVHRGPAPGERHHRRHHRHALAAFPGVQRTRRRAVGGHLGQRRLPGRQPHRHDLQLHHPLLLLRADRARRGHRRSHRPPSAASPPGPQARRWPRTRRWRARPPGRLPRRGPRPG